MARSYRSKKTKNLANDELLHMQIHASTLFPFLSFNMSTRFSLLSCWPSFSTVLRYINDLYMRWLNVLGGRGGI